MNVRKKRIVIVSGPQGCGKTQVAEGLREVFDCERVVDEWNGKTELQPGDVAVTNLRNFDVPFGATTVMLAG